MQLASIPTRALLGIEAPEVTVEVHLSPGLPSFAIVGMPETAVKESKERVRSAILNTGLEFPSQRITVNLAPADLPKAGGRYDLAIALAILVASDQMDSFGDALNGIEMLGELALDGGLRPVPGVVQALLAARSRGRAIVVPSANRDEVELVDYSLALAIADLGDLFQIAAALAVEGATLFDVFEEKRATAEPKLRQRETNTPIFAPVRGQARALRALEVAAAGGHNVLMLGPPGSGKTLLATTLSKLLPPMNRKEVLEVAAIRSVASGALALGSARERPMRAPHHSATMPSLVGGGAAAVPGDITLAHRGVLFLDELTEFKPSVLNALREPLEEGKITISRARYRVEYPANFQLVAAMNPCPCGFASDPHKLCRCTPDRVRNYLSKLSGPLLDRFDMIIEVPALSHAELLAVKQEGRCDESQQENRKENRQEKRQEDEQKDEQKDEQNIEQKEWQRRRKKIAACRSLQARRQNRLNSEIESSQLEAACNLDSDKQATLVKLLESLKVSARGAHRILRMARTLADLEEAVEVQHRHFLEAASYRRCKTMEELL